MDRKLFSVVPFFSTSLSSGLPVSPVLVSTFLMIVVRSPVGVLGKRITIGGGVYLDMLLTDFGDFCRVTP